jgi:hypothetical protein
MRLLVLQAPWSCTDRDVLESQWPTIVNKSYNFPAVHNTTCGASAIDNMTLTPPVTVEASATNQYCKRVELLGRYLVLARRFLYRQYSTLLKKTRR